MPDWSHEQETAGRSVVRHHAPPRFTAYWTSGADGAPAPGVPCWHDAGSDDGADSLHIFGIQWHDRRPDAETFDRLMQEAAKAIDDWIASLL